MPSKSSPPQTTDRAASPWKGLRRLVDRYRDDDRTAVFAGVQVPRRAWHWIVLSMAMVVGISILADYILRADTLRGQRSEVELQTRIMADALEREIRDRVAMLEEFALGLGNGTLPDAANFSRIAAAFTVGDTVAVGIEPSVGTALYHIRSSRFDKMLGTEAFKPRTAGAGAVATGAPGASMFMIWTTIPEPGPSGGVMTAKVLIEADPLLGTVGLHGGNLDVALSVDSGPEIVLDRAYAPGADPVEMHIALLGEEWVIKATPVGGWSSGGLNIWAVWVQAVTAIILVAAMMLWESAHYERLRAKNIALEDREADLERLSGRLSLALDASNVGVWEYLVDTDVLIWDKKMYELYATPRGETLDLEIGRRRIHPEDRANIEKVFANAVETVGQYQVEFRLLLPDMTIRHIRAIGTVHVDRDGARKAVGINLDITEQVLSAVDLEAKRHDAELASLAKSQFLATMSHEIRTPMNGVIGMLDLMLRSDLDPAQRERATVAAASAGQLLTLLNDVLDFSKLDANRIELRKADLDIRRLAQDVAALAAATVGDRKVRILVNVAPNVPEIVVCDPLRLRQILNNLVGNAVKFTDLGTVEIEIAFSTTPWPELFVSVRDTGIGIPEAEKQHLFERYSQIESAMDRTRGGTGLGLAICKQLVELMGGQISVRSVYGLGSTFEFSIPIDWPVESVEKPRARASVRAESGARPIRILVAEDNPTNQQVLSAYLELGGHSVNMVSDGEAALEQLRREKYDLVLMDIQMPKLDGIATARRLRAGNGQNARVPVVALTANALPGDREAYFEAGMTEYLSKPVSADELSEVIDRLTAGSRKVIPLTATGTVPSADAAAATRSSS